MREFLNVGQTWVKTHIPPEELWKKENFLEKTPPKPIPALEDESFTVI